MQSLFGYVAIGLVFGYVAIGLVFLASSDSSIYIYLLHLSGSVVPRQPSRFNALIFPILIYRLWYAVKLYLVKGHCTNFRPLFNNAGTMC